MTHTNSNNQLAGSKIQKLSQNSWLGTKLNSRPHIPKKLEKKKFTSVDAATLPKKSKKQEYVSIAFYFVSSCPQNIGI